MTSHQTDERFAFGANWRSYVDTIYDERRLNDATASLQRLLVLADLEGKSFLDIGCGSGLFSLAACMLGAERVISFDYDQNSVEATKALRARAQIPEERWQVMQGSVLDQAFLATIEPADIVYSWGVLHHTGAMWQAIDNAVGRVKPGGLLSIAIYNKVESRIEGSRVWWRIKRQYNRSSPLGRRAIELAYVANVSLRHIVTGRNPLKTIRHYDDGNRGMDFWHDVRDWVGGFPFEYASSGEIFTYLHDRHGLQLEYMDTLGGHACNEFTFRRRDA